ncbi:MAG: molecular chaperone DnaK [Nitrospirae bacterium]|nr:molecular chaperone DnaK [Nitrospirota bacterium]
MNRIVGIDLGTTNSLVAYMDGRQPVVIAGRDGSKLVPSVLSFEEDGVLIGDEAKLRGLTNGGRTVYSIKRLMGKGIRDLREDLGFLPYQLSGSEEGIVRVRIGEREYTPPELSAMILGELKRRAEEHFGEEVNQAVITVPAYFNDSQRQATKDAGRIAGLEVLRIVNEPTAASLAYGLQEKKEGVVAVYDLGGGTFDISLLKIREGIFEVLATNGITHLGGDDFDHRLMALVFQEMAARYGLHLEKNPEMLQRVRLAVEEAKCRLSTTEETSLRIPLPDGREYLRTLTRGELESLIADLVEKSLGPCLQALKDAHLSPAEVDEVLLVGGSTRIPLVQRRVAELFGKPPHCEINPDEVVALGAAIQAQILAGEIQDLLLLDVTPLSLGIETMGGVMNFIIPRNTTIPTSAKEIFTTSVDGQRSVDIHVLQGERELANDNRPLARFQLRDIEPLPAGMPRIEVMFLIDANGILNVTARDARKGVEQSIQVKPSYGLTDEQVEQMIRESFEFAERDVAQRLLIEARNEADTLVWATEKGLVQGSQLIPEEETAAIRAALAELKAAREGEDHHRIRESNRRLNEASHHLAEALMDAALKEAVQQKKLDEVLKR